MNEIDKHREMVFLTKQYSWLDRKLRTRWMIRAFSESNDILSNIPWVVAS